MYVRLFDVDDGQINGPVPKGETDLDIEEGISCRFVPVVFITNRALLCVKDSEGMVNLSAKMYRKILKMTHSYSSPWLNEVQLDCDWTPKTAKKYFCLLRALKTKGLEVSATLRLWQVKYPEKSGVPPADRVMLMAYNLNSPERMTNGNSILELNELKRYLGPPRRYPLPMDVVLPVFSWGKLYREGNFMGLINNLDEDAMKRSRGFSAGEVHTYNSKRDTVIGSFYLREGDQVSIEEVKPEVLNKASGILSDYLMEDKLNVAFYHYDTLLINRYGNDFLEKTFNRFR